MIINFNLLKKIGFILFLIGIFILPTMFFFAGISLFLAGIIGSFINKQNYFEDNWNKIFFICGVILIISLFTHIYKLNNSYSAFLDPNSSILGIFNWLPFFWLFWALQPYLDSKEKRKKTALTLIAGTFPVLISGFGQYFFNWTGPFEIFNGLIVWYQRPLGGLGLTGPFNNQNYAGAWLSLVWPFSIAFLIEKVNSYFRKSTAIFFFLTIGLAALLTNSRNAWASILLSLTLLLKIRRVFWLFPIICLISLVITITSNSFFTGEFQEALRTIIPDKIWSEFAPKSELSIAPSRIDIFLSSIEISFIEPIFGLGGSSFPIIYELQNNIWRGHPHNLFLELAVSYGYPITILLFSIISYLLINAHKILFISKSQNDQYLPYEKAWWVSSFLFILSQLFDVQYFDGRISIVFWVLLAGLKTITEEKIPDK